MVFRRALQVFCYFCRKNFKMQLIADSGSTKTDWALIEGGQLLTRIETQGINPFHESRETMERVLLEELLPRLTEGDITEIFFYGSGCTREKAPELHALLHRIFPEVQNIHEAGDLLAAARAVCGRKPGIACILGTGANSCLYDGEKVVMNTPPLGYILGDEGSGAVLGKRFLNAIFKGFLPVRDCDDYLAWSGLTYPEIIDRVYRCPMANRFLASVAEFIARNIARPELAALVKDNFRDFFRCNLVQYQHCLVTWKPETPSDRFPIGVVGGIAFQFSDLLRQVACEEGYELKMVERNPIDGLVRYHCGKV